jgi:hypothetical protein
MRFGSKYLVEVDSYDLGELAKRFTKYVRMRKAGNMRRNREIRHSATSPA